MRHTDDFIRLQAEGEESLLIQAVTQFLGREPEEEDLQHFQRVLSKSAPSDSYKIAYKGEIIGDVETERDGLRVRCTFIPAKRKTLLQRIFGL